MALTTFSGPLRSGTVREGAAANLGHAMLYKAVTLTQDGVNAVSATMIVPANATIVGFSIDVLVAFDSAVDAVLTIGTAAAGAQYVAAYDPQVAGRTAAAHTAAQAAAMANVGANTNVVVTITPDGATTAGSVRVGMLYVQN